MPFPVNVSYRGNDPELLFIYFFKIMFLEIHLNISNIEAELDAPLDLFSVLESALKLRLHNAKIHYWKMTIISLITDRRFNVGEQLRRWLGLQSAKLSSNGVLTCSSNCVPITVIDLCLNSGFTPKRSARSGHWLYLSRTRMTSAPALLKAWKALTPS